MSAHLLNNSFSADFKSPASVIAQTRWCPNCEQHSLIYRQSSGDRAYWQCRDCQYTVSFQPDLEVATDEDACPFLWKLTIALLLACLVLISTNWLEAKLRSRQEFSSVQPLPSFTDLK